MKRHYVYIVTNTVNSTAYVGKHSTAKMLAKDRYLGGGVALNHAKKKHGRDKFSIFYLEEFPSHEAAYVGEAEYVAYYRSIGMELYNLNAGGVGSSDPSMETCAKLSAANKGRKHSLETRKKQSEKAKGNTYGKGNKGKKMPKHT